MTINCVMKSVLSLVNLFHSHLLMVLVLLIFLPLPCTLFDTVILLGIFGNGPFIILQGVIPSFNPPSSPPPLTLLHCEWGCYLRLFKSQLAFSLLAHSFIPYWFTCLLVSNWLVSDNVTSLLPSADRLICVR